MLRGLCKNHQLSPEETEDALQEIFLKAFESLSLFRGNSEFSSYLYAIGRNYLSKSKPSKEIPTGDSSFLDTLVSSAKSHWKRWKKGVDLEFESIEISEKIKEMISNLPNIYKKPIHLYYFENFSYQEISEILNIKLNTLKSQILRGKEILREKIENEFGKYER
jgi:RNA polymerase sigma-70 factor (ECF subfamily)